MIADRVRTLRQKNNWSQTDLAGKLGITRSSVNAWELGISTPSTSIIIQLSNIFHVPSDYILEISNNPDIVNLEQLTEQEKEVVRKMLDCFMQSKAR